MLRIVSLVALGLALGPGAASAQTSPDLPSRAADPASPGPIGTAPDRSVTATGQTKPPGAAVGDNLGSRPDLDEKSRELDRAINRGICRGCN